MGRYRLRIFIALSVFLLCQACFRESTVEQSPTTTTQTTVQNLESLPTGTDALGQTNDFVLESATLQAVVNGGTEDLDRKWYLAKNAGSIFDLSTRFESSINRQLFSRNDDGLQQMTQGVNMNRHTLVSYDSVRVVPIDRNISTLAMTGRIFDMDGSLEAAGAAVDTSTRALLNCEVETVLEVRNNRENPNNDEFDFLVFYLSLTTVIKNTGDTPLPIFTVNDIFVTQYNAYSLFVPYPDWGFERPQATPVRTAYPAFLQFQPRQFNTAHYGMTSLMDGVLMANEERLPDDQMDITYIGKATQRDRTLAAGDAMTFVRECFALNGLSSANETFLNIEGATTALVDVLQLGPPPESPFAKTGTLTLTLQTNRDQDGQIVVEMFNPGISYFTGEGYVPLEEGRFLPVFGSLPVFSSYSDIPLPVGRARIRGDLANGDPVVVETNIITTVDQNGETVTTEEPIDILEDVRLTMQGVEVSALPHASVSMRILNESGRIIFGHGILTELDESNDILLGELPDHTQGRVIYIDSINSNAIFLPEGEYFLSVTHGPRFGLNSPSISVGTTEVAGSDPPQTVFGATPASLTFTLSEQVPLTGYWAADFDVRTDNDPSGLVSTRDLVRFAHSEDLDVLFAADARNPSEIEIEQRIVALGIGSLDLQDLEKEIDSFFDEVAVSRAIATYGRQQQAPQKLGRFSMFNLPKADEDPDFVVPAFEGDPAGFYDRVREKNPNVVIQATRPRKKSGLESGLFTAIAEMAGLPENTPIPGDDAIYAAGAATGSSTKWVDFDLLQVLSGNSYDEYLLSRQDWFGLLNQGIFRPATGGTLPGEVKDLPLGTVRTYVKVGEESLRDNDLQSFWEATKAGNSFVTNGPIIEASINGSSFGESTTASGTVALNLKVSAAQWIPVEEIRIVVDGTVQDVAITLNEDAVVRFDGTISLNVTPNQAHWVVIEAGTSLANLLNQSDPGRQYSLGYPGHKPLAFTNPIFLR